METSAPNGPTVLILEDDDLTRSSLRRVLAARGFRVVGAATGHDAVDVCRHQSIDVLLCDLVLPDAHGIAVAAEIHGLRPNLKIVFMSGYGDDPTVRATAALQGIELLEKPFTNADLTLKLQTALAS
jgi:two-component system cell cycle sensor histidine kinase/response regulator CckA